MQVGDKVYLGPLTIIKQTGAEDFRLEQPRCSATTFGLTDAHESVLVPESMVITNTENIIPALKVGISYINGALSIMDKAMPEDIPHNDRMRIEVVENLKDLLRQLEG